MLVLLMQGSAHDTGMSMAECRVLAYVDGWLDCCQQLVTSWTV